MADDKEFCEVTINGEIYRDWVSVMVRIGVELPIPIFRLQTIEPSDKELNERFLKIKPGHEVNIKVTGGTLMKAGYVESRQVSYDDTRHAVQIDGLAAAGPSLEVSVDRKDVQFQNYKLEALANKLLEPLKVKFKLDGQSKHTDVKFPNVIIYRGERIFEAVDRLCRQRGVWLYGDTEGNLVGGTGGAGGGGSEDLIEGQNIVKASLYEKFPEYARHVIEGQDQGKDDVFARTNAEVGAKAEVKNGKEGRSSIELGGRMNKEEAQARADYGAKALAATHMRVVVEHQGWTKPNGGGFWKVKDEVRVKSPMLFLKENEDQRLRLWSATWQQNASGTTCNVELVNDAAWNESPNASGETAFTPKVEPAQPEEPPDGEENQ